MRQQPQQDKRCQRSRPEPQPLLDPVCLVSTVTGITHREVSPLCCVHDGQRLVKAFCRAGQEACSAASKGSRSLLLLPRRRSPGRNSAASSSKLRRLQQQLLFEAWPNTHAASRERGQISRHGMGLEKKNGVFFKNEISPLVLRTVIHPE